MDLRGARFLLLFLFLSLLAFPLLIPSVRRPSVAHNPFLRSRLSLVPLHREQVRNNGGAAALAQLMSVETMLHSQRDFRVWLCSSNTVLVSGQASEFDSITHISGPHNFSNPVTHHNLLSFSPLLLKSTENSSRPVITRLKHLSFFLLLRNHVQQA